MKLARSRTAKVAVSLPRNTFDEIEQFRKELKIGRSAVILQAILLWLSQKHQAALEEKYAQGYKKIPERAADLEALYRAGLEGFTPEEW